jgi:hypothetical protein
MHWIWKSVSCLASLDEMEKISFRLTTGRTFMPDHWVAREKWREIWQGVVGHCLQLHCGRELTHCTIFFFYGVRWDWVHLVGQPLSATIVPAPDGRWWWVWSSRWNENWQGKPKYSEETSPSATLSTTDPTWPDLGSNPGRRGGKPATIAWPMARSTHCNLVRVITYLYRHTLQPLSKWTRPNPPRIVENGQIQNAV